jgi:hypothetical protein
MASIKISELNNLLVITSDDFFPIDDSGSMTTYRVSVSALTDYIAASGSALTASFTTSASYARYAISASYSISSSNSITSSYSISSSYALSASYALTSSNAITASNSITASYSISASNAISSSYAFSSSNAITASNAISSSYAFSSSHAITSSNAITAAFAHTTSPTSLVYAPSFTGLRIIPSWETFGSNTYGDIPHQQIQIKVDGIVLYNVGQTNSKVLQNKYVLVDRSLPSGTANPNTGSLDTGVFSINQWYNIWIIYNSTTTDVSGIISLAGGSPSNIAPTLPTGYDYYVRVGCIKDSAGTFWREWYEYSYVLKWYYRTGLPLGYGLSGGGFNLVHYFGNVPRSTNIRMKLKLSNASTINAGFTLGDEFRADDFISDIGDGPTDFQMFGTAATDSYLKVWRTRSDRNIRSSNATSGNDGDFWGNGSTFFDMLIISSL